VTLLGLALTAAVKARALELGFDRVAIGPATPPPHGATFERWLAAGYAGTMDYLSRGREARLDPQRLLTGARSVIAVALNYAPASEAPGWEAVARYARGRDYHHIMRPRLEGLGQALRELGGPEIRWRACVDTSAVLERDLAAAAGLGWIGKNTNLLHPDLGSFFFIGIVLTTAVLDADAPLPDRCGTCTACLDACPTRAFAAPYVLDARRCISYLTIEHRGTIDERLRPAIGEWVFGCDVCQTVCPWNRKAPATTEAALAAEAPLPRPEELLTLDETAFRARFRGSAMTRAKRQGCLRNVAIALGNHGDPASLPALVRARNDPDPVVSEAAGWAIERIRMAEAPGASGSAPVRDEFWESDRDQADTGRRARRRDAPCR
jgi:epoxyqueuosine reductase